MHEFRVIVCGGRGFGEVAPDLRGEARSLRRIEADMEIAFLFRELDKLSVARGGITFVMTGGIQRGADRFGLRWAANRLIKCENCEANWIKFGRAAGPIRNGEMLAACRPHLVVAFDGGAGTKDMTRQARAAGVEVVERLMAA